MEVLRRSEQRSKWSFGKSLFLLMSIGSSFSFRSIDGHGQQHSWTNNSRRWASCASSKKKLRDECSFSCSIINPSETLAEDNRSRDEDVSVSDAHREREKTINTERETLVHRHSHTMLSILLVTLLLVVPIASRRKWTLFVSHCTLALSSSCGNER